MPKYKNPETEFLKELGMSDENIIESLGADALDVDEDEAVSNPIGELFTEGLKNIDLSEYEKSAKTREEYDLSFLSYKITEHNYVLEKEEPYLVFSLYLKDLEYALTTKYQQIYLYATKAIHDEIPEALPELIHDKYGNCKAVYILPKSEDNLEKIKDFVAYTGMSECNTEKEIDLTQVSEKELVLVLTKRIDALTSESKVRISLDLEEPSEKELKGTPILSSFRKICKDLGFLSEIYGIEKVYIDDSELEQIKNELLEKLGNVSVTFEDETTKAKY